MTTQDLAVLLPAPVSADIALLRNLDGTVYTELMKLARDHLGRSGTLSLDAPCVVHEAYLRLARQGALQSAQRRTFYAYASRVMRTVIVDYIRERRARVARSGRSALAPRRPASVRENMG